MKILASSLLCAVCAFGLELNAEMKAYCVSSHGNNLSQKAQNIFTGKDIDPLAPSVNKARLSDVKEVKKWLKKNNKDVFLREGKKKKKGDVLYYIMSK